MTDLEQVAASHGFTAVKSEPIREVEGTVHLMHHAASGARLMFIENDDANKAFSITFKTRPPTTPACSTFWSTRCCADRRSSR